MVLSIVSFGYKHGIPPSSDLVFDVRFLPNPFFVDDLKDLTGEDRPVQEYLRPQRRFRHLFEPTRRDEVIAAIQKNVDDYWAKCA